MASVYYLFDDAMHVADDIVAKYSVQGKNLEENHHAAIIIQRSYRGYLSRKAYVKKIRAAITLQKYIRGWLVRYYLPDKLQEQLDRAALDRYNKAATKLQAAWRGVMTRNEVDMKEILAEKRKAESEKNIFSNADLEFSKSEHSGNKLVRPDSKKSPFVGFPVGLDLAIQAQIFEMMFNRHHLLSTRVQQGVLTANNELKEIEKILKSFKWKNFMKQKRRIYNKNHDIQQNPRYIFTDRRMRKLEDVYRLKDKNQALKEVIMDCVADDRAPFKTFPKVEQTAYERSLSSGSKYTKPITTITRTEDKSKNISKTDFVLTLRDVVAKCGIPPYYIDFWYNECVGHHLSL